MKYLLASEIVDTVNVERISLVQCPECRFYFLPCDMSPCPDCEHVACQGCMDGHVKEPHVDDYDNSPYAHGAWRKYDA